MAEESERRSQVVVEKEEGTHYGIGAYAAYLCRNVYKRRNTI